MSDDNAVGSTSEAYEVRREDGRAPTSVANAEVALRKRHKREIVERKERHSRLLAEFAVYKTRAVAEIVERKERYGRLLDEFGSYKKRIEARVADGKERYADLLEEFASYKKRAAAEIAERKERYADLLEEFASYKKRAVAEIAERKERYADLLEEFASYKKRAAAEIAERKERNAQLLAKFASYKRRAEAKIAKHQTSHERLVKEFKSLKDRAAADIAERDERIALLLAESEAAAGALRERSAKADERHRRLLAAFHGRSQRADLSGIASYAQQREEALQSDAIFASLGKSGRTWVRYVMLHYLELRHAVKFTDKSRSATGFGCFQSVLFTEDYFNFFLDEPGEPFVVLAPEMRDRALIVLVRDPRDTIISSYYWTLFHRKMLPEDVSLREFVHSEIYGVERASRFVSQLLDVFDDHAGPKHLLVYEDCWKDPVGEFTRLLRFLDGEQFRAESLAGAVERAAFENMQKQEISVSEMSENRAFQRIGVRDWDGNLNALKVRKGGAGGFRDEAPWLRDCEGLPATRRLVDRLSRLRKVTLDE